MTQISKMLRRARDAGYRARELEGARPEDNPFGTDKQELRDAWEAGRYEAHEDINNSPDAGVNILRKAGRR